jgi:predicted dehydrogenase
MERVGIGVIGCGIGSWHLDGYAEDKRACVIALAGQDDRCAQLANDHGVPHVYSDHRELLTRPDIDAVSIAVPNFLHAPIGLDALAAGKHVLMEKPLANTVEDAERLVRAAEESGLVLGIVFNRRSRADMQVLRKHMLAGHLGEVYHARAFWRRRSGIPGLGSWFTSKEAAGGGPLIDLGVHVLDMALWLMTEPEIVRVSGVTYAKLGPRGVGNWGGSRFQVSKENPYEVEDLAIAMLRTSGGATINLEASWAEYSGITDEFGVYLLGDRGGAELHVKDYATVDTLRLFGDLDGVPLGTMPRLQPKKVTQGHAEIISRFLDSIMDGVPMSPDGREGLSRTRLIDSIYRSAAEGREIETLVSVSTSEVRAA